jgi:putative transposase
MVSLSDLSAESVPPPVKIAALVDKDPIDRFCHVSRHIGAAGSTGSGFLRLPLDGTTGLIAMDCGGCSSPAVTEPPHLTAQGYRRFRCRDCGKQFNERIDGVLNRASLPSDVIAFVVFCRLRYRLTLRDLSEIMLLRGFTVSRDCIRQWEAKLLPVMEEALRKRRHGTGRRSGQSWYVDETYLKVQGRWCYMYRAIDRDGNLIDTMPSATRDMRAVQRFFRSARSVAGFVPDRVTTDGHNSYPRAIRSTLGRDVRHRRNVYLNNRLGQDHRGIKGRIRCMRGFKEHDAADRFCREQDELRNFLRSRSRHNQYVPANRRAVAFSIAPASRWASCRSHNQSLHAARCVAKGARRDRTRPDAYLEAMGATDM